MTRGYPALPWSQLSFDHSSPTTFPSRFHFVIYMSAVGSLIHVACLIFDARRSCFASGPAIVRLFITHHIFSSSVASSPHRQLAYIPLNLRDIPQHDKSRRDHSTVSLSRFHDFDLPTHVCFNQSCIGWLMIWTLDPESSRPSTVGVASGRVYRSMSLFSSAIPHPTNT